MKKFFSIVLVFIFTICLNDIIAKANNFPSEKMINDIIGNIGIKKRVEDNQPYLWAPVSSIEDGAIYMIRSVENPNLYWDLTGGNLNNGTQVQLYNLNYSHAQKFYFKKQFDVNGISTFRLAPLFSYDKVLRTNNNNDNSILQIADETYSDVHLFSDKLCFVSTYSGSTQFNISTCYDNNLNKMLSVDSIASGQKIKQKNNSSYALNPHRWEVIKTDYLGLNVGNKVHVNGLNEIRYVARTPHIGKYVIETRTYDNNPLDTFLRLIRDSDGEQVAQNDDSGVSNNALITYDFEAIEEFSVLVRGFSSSVQGYCHLILRPQKTIYMTGTYDIDNQKRDRVTALNNSKNYIRDLGYFPEVYGNLDQNTVFNETDWEDKKKIDRDYYLFYGHGGNNGAASIYFDGPNANWAFYDSLPNFYYADLVIWMICNGANYDPENGYYHCMALDTVIRGANRSIGFRGSVYNVTCDKFIPKLFQALKTNTLEDAVVIASQHAIDSNWIWWLFWGQFVCDIANPVMFSYGNRSGLQLNAQTNNAEDTKQQYIEDKGFIRKKNALFHYTDKLYESLEYKIKRLEKQWDDVLLFLGGESSSPRPIAMCSDSLDCVTEYYVLETDESVVPDYFDKLMGVTKNEKIS